MSLRLRPHHILCSIGYRGEGYNGAFEANMNRIVNGQLRGNDGSATTILITGQADAICAPCPRRVGMGCVDNEKIDRIDSDHGAILGVAPGDVLTWEECLDKVRARVRPKDLDHICRGCRWLALGHCKAAVARLCRETNTEAGNASDSPPERPALTS
ncbi:MAG: DUF1284 domain-containing protein [Pseudomonadota bacterium]